ncbi:14857_t:CDS:2, partial [Racocetra persica]
QTIPISISDKIKLTPSDLFHASPLLLYSTPVIPDFYFSNNDLGIESFILSKKTLQWCHWKQKYRVRIGTKKMLHIIASDIKWNYASNEQSPETSNKEKEKAQNDINNHFDTIEEKYAKLSSSFLRKRKQSNLLTTSFSSKTQKASPETEFNFLNTISQIKNTDP